MARSHQPAPSGPEGGERERGRPRAPQSDPGLGRTGPGGLSLGALHSLQGLAGNAAVSRLVKPPDETTDPAAEAGQAFARRAERELGLPEGSAPGPSEAPAAPRPTTAARPDGRGPQAARAEAGQARQQARAELATVRTAAAKGPAPRVQAPPVPADAIAPEARPEAIAAEVEARRAPVGDLTVPLDEAGGAGPGSEEAVGRLRSAEHVPSGLVALGEAISTRIAGLRAKATANVARVGARLRGEAESERGGVRGRIAASRAAVGGIIGGARSRITGAAGSSRRALSAKAGAAREEIDQAREAETARLGENIDRGTQEARTSFGDADRQVAEAGTREAARTRQHAGDLAERALALGRSAAQDHRRTEEDEDLAQRKAEAVTDVAQRFARKLRGGGDDLAGQIGEQTGQAREQVGEEAEPTIKGVGEIGQGSSEGIRSLFGSVGEGVGSVTRQGEQHLDAARSGALREVDNVDQAAEGRGIALRAEGEASLDAALATGLVAQANLAGQAGALLDQSGRDAIDQLTGMVTGERGPGGGGPGADVVLQRQPRDGGVDDGGQPPGGVGVADREQAVAPLDRLGPGLDQAADSQTDELAGTLSNASRGAEDAGTAWQAETRTTMDSLGTTAETGLAQVVDAAGGQVDATVAAGRDQARGALNRVAGQVDARVAEVRTSVQQGAGEAAGGLTNAATEGARRGDETLGQLPAAMASAAKSQESWFGRATSWVSDQLSDTWEAIKGMADWRFVASLVVGIAVSIAVGVGVALLIAAAPFTLPGLAVALIVGAAAGAAGFAAAQITGNVLDPNPGKRWYDGVGHAALLGAFVGAAAGGAVFAEMSLVAGTALVMGAAGVGTVVANLATGRPWDQHLLANVTIIGVFHGVIRAIVDRIPGRGTGTMETSDETSPYRPPPPTATEVVVDSPGRIVAGDMRSTGHGWECELLDSTTGTRYGFAEVEADASGAPKGGPHLTIDPTNARMPNGARVRLKAQGFSWTDVSLKAAIDAYIRKFGRGPTDMGGLLAWKNLINFQTEFAKIRAENPGLAEGVVAERAAKAISFGQARIRIGYGDIRVRYGNMGDVTLPDGTVLGNVPKWVEILAGPTHAGPLPTLPQRDETAQPQ